MKNIILAGLLVFVLTSLGSVFAVFFKKLPQWGFDFSLAFSGGIMLVASFTSLIFPAINQGGIYITILGIVLGFLLVFLLEKFIPHEEYFFKFKNSSIEKERLKSIFLIVSAIIIHNLPEGMAVGTAMANDVEKGWATAIAIGIQDIPEGLAVSLPLVFLTGRLIVPIIIGILSGLSEFIFAVFGGFAFSVLNALLPLGLALAGGAMVYVTVKEVFPEVYKNEKNKDYVTLGFLTGMLIMLYLDVTLG